MCFVVDNVFICCFAVVDNYLIEFKLQPLPFGQHFECEFSYFILSPAAWGMPHLLVLSQRFGQKADVECMASLSAFLSWFLPHFSEVEVALNCPLVFWAQNILVLYGQVALS